MSLELEMIKNHDLGAHSCSHLIMLPRHHLSPYVYYVELWNGNGTVNDGDILIPLTLHSIRLTSTL